MRPYVVLLTVLSIGVAQASSFTPNCKCVPGDLCWPSLSDFSSLNDTLSGRLIQGIPPASVCYESEPNYNTAACDLVSASWYNSSFHAADPISIGWPWWANNSCPPIFPNGTSITGDPEAGARGCSIGSYPAYSVNATEVEHVVAAVQFAKKWNVRLNVKSTGHSFQGRSTAFGSLSVWTHHMRGIQHHDSFQPDSCPSNFTQLAFTISAGERVRDIYKTAASHGAIVVAGSARDVGIIGWFASGGHGPLSSTYGLGVDNVLQVRIVAPNGQFLTANPCLNPDIFWAVRGGGGGTFGVLIEVTMKAYPSPQTTHHTFSMSLIDKKNETGFFDLLATILGELPRLKEGGIQGYSILRPPAAGGPEAWTYSWSFNIYDRPNGTGESLIAPLTQKLDPGNGTTIIYTTATNSSPDYFSIWDIATPEEPVAVGGPAFGSRLLPADSLTQDTGHLARVLQNISQATEYTPPPALHVYMVANSNREVQEKVSVTPAWRDAVLHFIIIEGFKDSETFSEAKPVLDTVTYDKTAALKSLAPESGAYHNECDPFDPNWQYDFWGENYPRLREIKKTYDPESMLWCISCVGSEGWAEDAEGRLCKVLDKEYN